MKNKLELLKWKLVTDLFWFPTGSEDITEHQVVSAITARDMEDIRYSE